MTQIGIVFENEEDEYPDRGGRFAMNTVDRSEFLKAMADQWDWYHGTTLQINTCRECFRANGHKIDCSYRLVQPLTPDMPKNKKQKEE